MFREDGYVNVLNRFGTSQDNSTAYNYWGESFTSDLQLAQHYETGGLLAKIIDLPAEEAVRHGFEIDACTQKEAVEDILEHLDWENKFSQALKWARLFGGSLLLLLAEDGGSLEEPLREYDLQSLEELLIFERSAVQIDLEWSGSSEFFTINRNGSSFRVHQSRCLIFRNGILPELSLNSQFRYWGIPEYDRIKNELKDVSIAHSLGVRLLERSVQPVYKMKDLARVLASEAGEESVLKRLQIIDAARGILNSVAIDSEGEDYDFKSFSFSGVAEIINSSCNLLAAVCHIPQTILFGRSPAGQNATGESDLENYYNYVEQIQKTMLKGNLRRLLDLIGIVVKKPNLKFKFNPLWSLSELEKAQLEKEKAAASLARAETIRLYSELQALTSEEIRRGLQSKTILEAENLFD
ncbi:MAG: DUF1073 domain-containing protein [Clostridia bacterium]|nr:DUF1073 domain-containing protein [Clostridia bacterium]